MLSQRDRETVDRLIGLAVDDDDERFILADLLTDHAFILSMKLRLGCRLVDLVSATRCGTPLARGKARRARSWEKAHVEGVYCYRSNYPVNSVEMEPYLLGQYAPSMRECEGSERFRAWIFRQKSGVWLSLLSGVGHCRRLVHRAWQGADVPPDVSRDLMRHIEGARQELRALAAVPLTR